MRRGVSIVELIFTVVIIALVFTVIPKMVFALKKSDSFAIRQDAILNTISLVAMASKLPWDEANVASSDILHVDNGNFTCNPDFYRTGGFVGSRNCKSDLNASTTFSDGESEEYFDDIDDYDGHDINTTMYNINTKIYNIHTTVSYYNDFASDTGTIDLNASSSSAQSTNLKRFHVKTTYIGNRGVNKELLNFSYTSANLGQFYIQKRVWK